ncbi:hypothetical protein D3C72_2066900 [compost metagenome]
MHEGDQFGHLGHLDALGHDRAGGAAEQQAEQHVADAGAFAHLRAELVDQRHGGEHGDAHAEHAEQVAAPRAGRVRQALERLDEEHRGDQVENGD